MYLKNYNKTDTTIRNDKKQCNTKEFRIAVIGCGSRGRGYPWMLKKLGLKFSLIALADPDEKALHLVNNLYAKDKALLFKNGEELIKKCGKELDGVIIASPNDTHTRPAALAIRNGIKLFLEKPVATRVEDFKTLWQTYSIYKTQNVVAFVLRYTPFYQKINQIVKTGMLGEIFSIDAAEIMSDRLSMLFTRGSWRPEVVKSGGLLLEKCCHDVDILNWLVDSKANRVFSFGSRKFFNSITSNHGEFCSDCPQEVDCRFSQFKIIESFKANTPAEHFDFNAAKSSDEKCAYCEHPYPDRQVMNIEYENGVICNLTVVQAQPKNERTIAIFGSKGRLYGSLNENMITVYHHRGPNEEEREDIKVTSDGTGHGGGDSVLNRDFIDLLQAKVNHVRPGLKEGIESAILCIAADESRETGQAVDIASYFKKVFS